jgi:hypothetical protein
VNKHIETVLSVRTRGRRVWSRAGAVLGAGLLMAAAACGGGEGSGGSGGAPRGDDSAGGDVKSAVGIMKVCELVDLEPLATTLTSPGYEFGPEDVPAGNGVDPGGPQCAAQLTLPPLTSVAGTKQDHVPARLNVAVVPYDDAVAATAQFDKRIGDSQGFPGSESEELDGPWTRGTIVTVEGGSDNLVHGLVQMDGLLVKIYLQFSPDKDLREKFAFTVENVKVTVGEVLTDLYAAVSAEVEG